MKGDWFLNDAEGRRREGWFEVAYRSRQWWSQKLELMWCRLRTIDVSEL